MALIVVTIRKVNRLAYMIKKLKMKHLSSILLVLLICSGCKKEHKNSNSNATPESFDLSDNINKELYSIRNISQFIVSQPSNQEAYDKNDSIARRVSVHTENIINLLIESYGKAPTDTILMILENLDNSGYIPIELYEKLNEEDFSTEIGKRARKAYQEYVGAKDDEIDRLKNINLLTKKLSLNRIIENDTVILRDLLLEHKGYKVLDFWATWCAPCRSFNKRFQSHYQEYRDKGIEFYGIGISIDNENERDKFLTAIKNDKTPWKQFIDLNNETYNLFETNRVPYQVLLNEDNRVIKILSHDINNELDEMLKKTNANNGYK